jgi:hypothetical protein
MSLDVVWELKMTMYETGGIGVCLHLILSYMQRSWAASTFACTLEVR